IRVKFHNCRGGFVTFTPPFRALASPSPRSLRGGFNPGVVRLPKNRWTRHHVSSERWRPIQSRRACPMARFRAALRKLPNLITAPAHCPSRSAPRHGRRVESRRLHGAGRHADEWRPGGHAVAGCYSVLKALGARAVVLAFDAPDVHTKPPVFEQTEIFWQALT